MTLLTFPKTGTSAAPAAVATGSIGDRVWYDTNGNGIQDAGEQGAAGITVTLAPTVPASSSTYFIQTTTDAQGHYQFNNLAANTYQVIVDLPNGYLVTNPWLQTQFVSLSNGQSNMSLDLGIDMPARLKAASLGNLSALLQPSDDLLHTALPSSSAAAVAADAHAPVANGSDALSMMLAAWNTHAAAAHAA